MYESCEQGGQNTKREGARGTHTDAYLLELALFLLVSSLLEVSLPLFLPGLDLLVHLRRAVLPLLL